MRDAAIFFLPDGYTMTSDKLMGRHAAGNAFLRAAVKYRLGDTVVACTNANSNGRLFADYVKAFDKTAKAQWIGPNVIDRLGEIGTLYHPSPSVAAAAMLRLRFGSDAYSICGVTHTTASEGAMGMIADLIRGPVMPWDALICTSRCVHETVTRLLDAELDYLKWRLGPLNPVVRPQLPVIPLGVHSGDYVYDKSERVDGRRALGIKDDEIMALFVGRLSFHAKAHPHAMYKGLQEAQRRTGKKIVLVQSGWFANKGIENSFRAAAKQTCPDVRCLFVDGKDQKVLRQHWASADIFVSLSDNIQETFGLTPIEAMAAGLPVVVSDWDGYKDTVRDGEDGYRIPTATPGPMVGDGLALKFESEVVNYDHYCGISCQTVAMDHAVLADRLEALVNDPELRARLGAAGRERARTVFDWGVLFKRYQALWSELGEIRKADRHKIGENRFPTPTHSPRRKSPYELFDNYPTHLIDDQSVFAICKGADAKAFDALAGLGVYAYATSNLPKKEIFHAVLASLESGPKATADIARDARSSLANTLVVVAALAKMGLIALQTEA